LSEEIHQDIKEGSLIHCGMLDEFELVTHIDKDKDGNIIAYNTKLIPNKEVYELLHDGKLGIIQNGSRV
jgi:hypothetical protein